MPQKETEKIMWSSYAFCLSRKLRAVRKLRGITQENLALLAGVSRSVITNLENNVSSRPGVYPDPGASTLYSIAQALEIPITVLLPVATEIPRRVCPGDAGILQSVDFMWPQKAEDVALFDATRLWIGHAPIIGVQLTSEAEILLETSLNTVKDRPQIVENYRDYRTEGEHSEYGDASLSAEKSPRTHKASNRLVRSRNNAPVILRNEHKSGQSSRRQRKKKR